MEDFERICQAEYQAVRRFLLRLSGNESLAEELTQETFYQAVCSVHRFEGRSKVTTWLCGIAKNLFYTYCRKPKPAFIDEVPEKPGEDFVDTLLEQCDLSGCDLTELVSQRVKFRGCRMTGADLVHTVLRNTAFDACRMDYVNLSRSKMERVGFTDCSLREAALEECRLSRLTLDECDLGRATIHQTPMKGVDLRTCRMDALRIGLSDVRGMIVSGSQAVALAALMGLEVKE